MSWVTSWRHADDERPSGVRWSLVGPGGLGDPEVSLRDALRGATKRFQWPWYGPVSDSSAELNINQGGES